MSWEVIPESEMPKVIEATREGRCVVCYGPVEAGHHFYCHSCDDGCGDECPIASDIPEWVEQCHHERVCDFERDCDALLREEAMQDRAEEARDDRCNS